MKRKTRLDFFRKVMPLLVTAAVAAGCVKGELEATAEPDTKMSIDEIKLQGQNRLNSSVKLSWFGTDEDGYIAGYETSVDNITWSFTNSQDSIIQFDIPAGQDTVNASFYVRAIDNDGNVDPTPAFLSIPLKNTPPEASFNNSFGPNDTVLAVSTFRFDVSDPDGDTTIAKIEMRFNNGNWYDVRKGETLISFVLDNSGTNATVYYGVNSVPAKPLIDGIIPDAINYLQLRVQDVSGAVSKVDSASAFYFKTKTAGEDLLWISGVIQPVLEDYKSMLGNINVSYDLLNLGSDLPAERLPAYWNPTVRLLANLYDKILFTSDRVTVTNPVNSKTNTLLNFAAPVIQDFSNNGGKILVTTSFGINEDVSSLVGPLPISGLENTQAGQARIFQDSSLVPLVAGPYPELHSDGTFTQIVPIQKLAGAEDFYRAELNRGIGPWTNTDVVGVALRPNNQLTQVLFGVQLHWFDPTEVETLLQQILVNEF